MLACASQRRRRQQKRRRPSSTERDFWPRHYAKRGGPVVTSGGEERESQEVDPTLSLPLGPALSSNGAREHINKRRYTHFVIWPYIYCIYGSNRLRREVNTQVVLSTSSYDCSRKGGIWGHRGSLISLSLFNAPLVFFQWTIGCQNDYR